MADPYSKYFEEYPDLVLDIMEYFDVMSGNLGGFSSKSVIHFCEKNRKDGITNDLPYQPNVVIEICERLNKVGMKRIYDDSGMKWGNNYTVALRDKDSWNNERDKHRHYYNSVVYGSKYIYSSFKDKVLPIVVTNNGTPSIGTCFRLDSGLVTAKHCLSDGDRISIKGLTGERLKDAAVYVSKDKNIDIAYIELNERDAGVWIDDPEVLDDVLVLGYPKVPGFIDFLAVEKATISSIEDKTFVQTQGSIAAVAKEYLSKMEMMLITAKIRGGNSGSPVINQQGSIIGIACHLPECEGDYYDEVGYGVSIPAAYVNEVKEEKNLLPNIPFADFEY